MDAPGEDGWTGQEEENDMKSAKNCRFKRNEHNPTSSTTVHFHLMAFEMLASCG